MIGGTVQTVAREVIELSFPASEDLVVLARFTAATVAVRAGFDVEEIEDLRLAVDELCVSLGPIGEGASVKMTFGWVDDTVTVACTLEEPGGGPRRHPADTAPAPASDLSEQLLAALVDDHGREVRHGRLSAWMTKRRGSAREPWNG